MLSVAFQETLPAPAPETVAAASAPRRLSVTAVLNARKSPKPRRSRTREQTISLPSYSRITYRAGTVTVR